MVQALAAASAEFDQVCAERWAKGAEEYGPFNFMEVNTLEMAMEEVVDLANYARMTYLKLYHLREFLAAKANAGPEFGPQNFKPTGE